jgi:hypothetical protein
MSGKIRLGCACCDRDDFDGVDELPTDWERITELQSYEQSLVPKGFSGRDNESCLDWQTHLGICPDCQSTLSGGDSE